jgi:hypothetical protein
MRTDRQTTAPRRSRWHVSGALANAGRGLLLVACGALGASAAPHAQSAQAAPGVSLYHRLALASTGAEHRLAIELSPRAWAVGRPDGPPASEAQLRAVLGQLAGIEIGGRCAQRAGNTAARACTFALAPPDFAGIVIKDHRGDTALGWAATATASSERSGAARDAPANPRPGFDAMRYFGLLAPEHFVDTPIAPLGARLALRYRAGAGELLPAGLDRASASLILHGGPSGAPPALAGARPE